MNEREAALTYLALNEAENPDDFEHFYDFWDHRLDQMANEEHYGDCVNVPMTCGKCLSEEAYEMAPVFQHIVNRFSKNN